MPTRPLNDNEVKQVLKHLSPGRDQLLFLIGLRAGFRISEILSLNWSDMVYYKDTAVCVNNTIVVKRANMKGKAQSRSVPMHNEIKDMIYATLKLNGIHIDSGESIDRMGRLIPMTRQHAWLILTTAYKTAGIEGSIGTHGMRKSFAQSVYKRSSKDIVATQKALGHKSLSSTTHYLSIGQDEVNDLIMGA